MGVWDQERRKRKMAGLRESCRNRTEGSCERRGGRPWVYLCKKDREAWGAGGGTYSRRKRKGKEKDGIMAQRKGLVKPAAMISYPNKERASPRPGKAWVAMSNSCLDRRGSMF